MTKQHLQLALKKAHLPYCYTTILKYEKKGIIPLPENPEVYKAAKRTWRSYSQEEIDNIVKLVKKYKDSVSTRGGSKS